MNNFERIKLMNIDELAKLLSITHPKSCGMCIGAYEGCLRQVCCEQSIKVWLESDKAAKGEVRQ